MLHFFQRGKTWYHLASPWFGTMHNWRNRPTHISNSKILVKTVNSDVGVIAISICHWIPNFHEFWAEFGRRKYIAVQTIASNYGVMLTSVLAFFHALSGSDTNSSIFGKSNKAFYDRWKLFPEITKVLVKLVTAL